MKTMEDVERGRKERKDAIAKSLPEKRAELAERLKPLIAQIGNILREVEAIEKREMLTEKRVITPMGKVGRWVAIQKAAYHLWHAKTKLSTVCVSLEYGVPGDSQIGAIWD